MVVFGGYGASTTFEFDGTNWAQVFPTAPPPGRLYPAMGYDSSRQMTVMYGGQGAGGVLGDTWEWDGTNWTLVATGPTPGPRAGADLVMEAPRQRPLLIGGGVADTWSYRPVVAAWFRSLGATCVGSGGSPSLRNGPTSSPLVGSALDLSVTHLPVGQAGFAFLGISDQQWAGVRLPLTLAGGCALSVGLDVSLPAFATGTGSATVTVNIPNQSSLVGNRFYVQCAISDPPANALGFTTSDAAVVQIGMR
jgi:hypothetical protein